jgi:hypothetical protein
VNSLDDALTNAPPTSIAAGTTLRLAFLHECLAPLQVVFACETTIDSGVAGIQIAIAGILYELHENPFHGRDGKGSIGSHLRRVFFHVTLERGVG